MSRDVWDLDAGKNLSWSRVGSKGVLDLAQ